MYSQQNPAWFLVAVQLYVSQAVCEYCRTLQLSRHVPLPVLETRIRLRISPSGHVPAIPTSTACPTRQWRLPSFRFVSRSPDLPFYDFASFAAKSRGDRLGTSPLPATHLASYPDAANESFHNYLASLGVLTPTFGLRYGVPHAMQCGRSPASHSCPHVAQIHIGSV